MTSEHVQIEAERRAITESADEKKRAEEKIRRLEAENFQLKHSYDAVVLVHKSCVLFSLLMHFGFFFCSKQNTH
jgi:hypothetical protein